jgi:hypothetical protein
VRLEVVLQALDGGVVDFGARHPEQVKPGCAGLLRHDSIDGVGVGLGLDLRHLLISRARANRLGVPTLSCGLLLERTLVDLLGSGLLARGRGGVRSIP